jgi:hypothetical protein
LFYARIGTVRTHTLLLLFAGLHVCSATVIPSLSFEDLIAKSEQVVSGTVTRSWASWGPEHKLIWTSYEIRVGDVIKGAKQSVLIVSEPGGSLDGLGMRVEGAVPYEAGERVTLFLQTYPSGNKRTVGWAQGKFTTDANGRVHPGSPGGRTEINLKTGTASVTSLSALDGISTSELRRRVIAMTQRSQVK